MGNRMRAMSAALLATTLAVTCSVSGTSAGAADAPAASTAQSTLVSSTPASASVTPAVNDGVVQSITRVGTWTVVGGSFTTVTPAGSTSGPESHPDVFAYDDTGAIDTTFAPQLNGAVNAVIPGPAAGTVYLGGSFTTVNGVSSRGVTLLDLANGQHCEGFLLSAVERPRLGPQAGERQAVVGRLLHQAPRGPPSGCRDGRSWNGCRHPVCRRAADRPPQLQRDRCARGPRRPRTRHQPRRGARSGRGQLQDG